MTKPIEIMIADDHLMIREGIKQLLELDGDIIVNNMAADGLECIEKVKNKEPDVLLLDINMPHMNGLQVLEYLKRNNSKIKILILTIHNEIDYLTRAIDYGVNGYVLKDSEYEILRKAINTVYNGETYIQSKLRPLLKMKSDSTIKITSDIDESLTKREMEVLKLVAEGLYNKEIAFMLEISEKTVKNHVSNIFKKINVSDRTQAAIYAIKNNYVDIFN